MPPIIRRATSDDVPAIRSLEQQAPTAAHWPPGEYDKLVAAAVLLVAEQQHELCGFVCAKPVAGDWEIENIVVGRGFLRQGIADALVRALIGQAGRAAVAKVLLEVRESNLPARRLYEKHGFRETGRRPNYYRNPPEDAVLYACPLSSQT